MFLIKKDSQITTTWFDRVKQAKQGLSTAQTLFNGVISKLI